MKRALVALLLLFAVPAWAANEFAFAPCGSTVLVDTTARQVTCSNGTTPQTYRVRNLAAAAAYLGWAPANSAGTTPPIATTAPVAGTPAANLIGMLAASVETFIFPANAWFQASAGATFEVTPGDGK